MRLIPPTFRCLTLLFGNDNRRSAEKVGSSSFIIVSGTDVDFIVALIFDYDGSNMSSDGECT